MIEKCMNADIKKNKKNKSTINNTINFFDDGYK